jgi:hypothetical protein
MPAGIVAFATLGAARAGAAVGAGAGSGAAIGIGGAAAAWGFPQLEQKRAPSALGAPHAEQLGMAR